MRRILFSLTVGLLALVAVPRAQAQTITLKLGTMAPDGSSWHRLLKEMGEEWTKASGGKVKLKVFAGGVAGDEGDTIRKMKLGQLHASALTAMGLQAIERSPQAISTPGLITSDAEWDYTFKKMQPIWEKRLQAKGFIPLMWGDTGWVYNYFTSEKRTPEQAKGTKMFVWSGDPGAEKGWKAAGFQPVVLSAVDIMTSLSTGMIEGVATSPVMAFTARYFERAKFMPDYAWCHLPAATVVSKEAWEKIPADLRPKLLEIARVYGEKVNAASAKMDADSLAQMKKNGLKVLKLTPAERQEWEALAQKVWGTIRGELVSAEEFDEVKRVRDEYRAAHGVK